MESESFDRGLRAFCRHVPFQSFTVELSDGARINVDHPEALVYRNGIGVYFAPDREITILDHLGVTRMIGSHANQSAPA